MFPSARCLNSSCCELCDSGPLLSSVLCDQELLQPHRLRCGRTLRARKRLLYDRSAHGQPLPEGESPPTSTCRSRSASGLTEDVEAALTQEVSLRSSTGRTRHTVCVSSVSGEAEVEEDEAGLSAGRRGVLRRRHLEHLVRPRPDRRGPCYGQGTSIVTARLFGVLPPSSSSSLFSRRVKAGWSSGWFMCPGLCSGSPTWPSTCRGTSTTRSGPTRRTTCQ